MRQSEMVGDIKNIFNVSLDCYITKLILASGRIEKLGVLLDPLLDKPFEESDPHYCCGDAMENVKEIIDDTVLQLGYIKRVVVATAAAWDYYPGSGEDDGYARSAYIHGYMNATE